MALPIEKPTPYEHIALDDQGVPIIHGTNTKVVEVVLHTRASGISPEQLHLELPHLSLGQIHSALAYYWDHRRELDRDIEKRRDRAEAIRSRTPEPPIQRRLRAERSV